MTRTTIRIDEHLLAEVKECALKTKRTLTEVIEDALRETLARGWNSPPEHREKIELPTYGGGGVQPGIDLSSTAAPLDVLDDERDPT